MFSSRVVRGQQLEQNQDLDKMRCNMHCNRSQSRGGSPGPSIQLVPEKNPKPKSKTKKQVVAHPEPLPLLRSLTSSRRKASAPGRWLNMEGNRTKLRPLTAYKSAWGLAQLKINSITQSSPAPTELRENVGKEFGVRERPSTAPSWHWGMLA